MKVAALVGMPGSGKSEVARVFKKHGYATVRFGDITDEEVKKRGLKLDEENERLVREELRDEARHGGLCHSEPAAHRGCPGEVQRGHRRPLLLGGVQIP